MIRRIWAAIAALSLVFVPVTAQAARVSPMIVDLDPSGRGAVARIELSSDSDRTIPYEVLMFRGDISTDGKLTLIPADADFLVFPTQVLLEGNSRQVFRIQYVGDIEVAKSEIFYMSIRQVPVALEEAQTSQVQVVVNYNVLVNIVPNNAEAEPAIRSITAATRTVPVEEESSANAGAEADGSEDDPAAAASAPDSAVDPTDEPIAADPEQSGEGQPVEATTGDEDEDLPTRDVQGLEVLVGNDGNRYFLAGLSVWKLSGTTLDGEPFSTELTADQISRFVGAGVVAPGKERRFFLPMQTQLDPASVTIEIEIPRER